jgi:3-oxoadipate enol-lactonase
MNGTSSAAPRRQRFEFNALLAMARMLRGIRPPLTRSVVGAFLGPTSRRERPDAVRTVLSVAQSQDIRSVSFAVRSVVLLREDQANLFGTIRTPVLVVAGREDTTFPLPEAERMAAAIPGAELVVLDGAAHLVALEVPETVNKLAEDFIDRARTGS